MANAGGIHHVSLDEKTFQRGYKYMTVLGDGMHGVVLDAHEGRDINSAHTVLEHTLGDKIAEIETVTTDMLKAFVNVAKTRLPEATLIHDHFHLIQYLNKGIDRVAGGK